MALQFLMTAQAASSMFKGPKKIGSPSANAFDRLAKDFNIPGVADIFGAQAQEDRDVKATEDEKVFDDLKKLTGVDIRAESQKLGGNLNKAAIVGTDTGQKVLEAVLAGKNPATIFGGIE